jgi:hypothetical protein
MVAAGPALQYAWKFPEKRGEFHFDQRFLWSISTTMKIPYLMDVWPSSAGFVYVIVVCYGPDHRVHLVVLIRKSTTKTLIALFNNLIWKNLLTITGIIENNMYNKFNMDC